LKSNDRELLNEGDGVHKESIAPTLITASNLVVDRLRRISNYFYSAS